MGGKHSEEFSQLFSSNTNDRCAMADWRNRSEARWAHQLHSHQVPCDNASIGDESFSKTLIFHLTNSVHLHDFELFYHHVKRSLRRLDCVQRNRTTVRRWHRAENEQINEIRFSNDSSNLHVLIEIHEISVNSFHYDLIVPMPEDSDARQTISIVSLETSASIRTIGIAVRLIFESTSLSCCRVPINWTIRRSFRWNFVSIICICELWNTPLSLLSIDGRDHSLFAVSLASDHSHSLLVHSDGDVLVSLLSPSISLDRQFSPRREEEEESEGNSLMNSHSSVDQCRCVGVTSLSHPADHVRRPVLHVDSLSNPIDQFLHSHQPILFHFDAFISGENSSLVRSALDLLEFLRRRTSCLRNDLVFPSVLLARLFSSSAVSLRTIVDR